MSKLIVEPMNGERALRERTPLFDSVWRGRLTNVFMDQEGAALAMINNVNFKLAMIA